LLINLKTLIKSIRVFYINKESKFLKNYCALYRRHKDINDILIGLSLMPNDWKEFNFEKNKHLLEHRLYEADAYEVPKYYV
jgi:hypothetical protein